MKKSIFITAMLLSFPLLTNAADQVIHLKTINAELAKAAFLSYSQGHYRYIQDGKLIEAPDVDADKASCIVEAGKMTFNPEASYALESQRSLDIDEESGEIELNFETQSKDADAYFQIYCFQGAPGATIETAREGLKSVFEF